MCCLYAQIAGFFLGYVLLHQHLYHNTFTIETFATNTSTTNTFTINIFIINNFIINTFTEILHIRENLELRATHRSSDNQDQPSKHNHPHTKPRCAIAVVPMCAR